MKAKMKLLVLRLQDPALRGVAVVPDVGAPGPGEAGGLAEDLHHLHAERHHRELGLCHLFALQSRGTGGLQPHVCTTLPPKEQP